jgi:hypothetical protein
MIMFRKYKDRETRERLKRWPSLFHRFGAVRIYSAEHRAYWRGSGSGYTENPLESNVMCLSDAFNKTRHCGPEKRIQYIEANLNELS